MNELRVFNNSEFGELKIMEIDGNPYFPATACARILGYERADCAIKQHCRYPVKHRVPHPQNPQKTIEMNFIPEGDLYRLIVHSRLPAAERFEKWVFEEVLPSIRKTGTYVPDLQAIVEVAVQTAVRMRQDPRPVMTKRLAGQNAGIIALLNDDIRCEIDCMLDSRAFTYVQISAFLLQNYGIQVGKSSVARYAKRVGKAGGISHGIPTWEQIRSLKALSRP